MHEDRPNDVIHPRPILIVDDVEAEALWVRDRLLEHGAAITRIANTPTAVEFETDARLLTARLVAALTAISHGDGDAFREVCRKLPSVVVLDQYLADAEPGSTSTKASLRIYELVNAIWDKASQSPTFQTLGWSLCILMYTGQDKRLAAELLNYRGTNKPWFDYAEKPGGIPAVPQETAEREGKLLAEQINGLNSKLKYGGAPVEVVQELWFAGERGDALREAVRAAAAAKLPVWIHGRWRDGCDKLVPLLVDADPLCVPKVSTEDELHTALHKMRTTRSVHPVFIIESALANAARMAHVCERLERKFVLVSTQPLGPSLALRFSVVPLVPLHEWSMDDIKELFRAGLNKTVSDDVVQWLKSQQFDYTDFGSFYFQGDQEVRIDLIKECCERLARELAKVELHANGESAIVDWEGENVIGLKSFAGLSALAILRAMADTGERTLPSTKLLAAMRTVKAKKVEEWVMMMSATGSVAKTWRQNHFVSGKGDGSALKVLDSIFGGKCIEGKDYDDPAKFHVKWIGKPNVRIVNRSSQEP